MRRNGLLAILIAAPALAAGSPPVREPFVNAHVSLMARLQDGAAEPRLADIDLWADGARLRARVRGDPQSGDLWIDGLDAPALYIAHGKVEEPARRTLERALHLALSAPTAAPHAATDRIAGRPCRVIRETLSAGATLTRCLWRGLPLSVELSVKGFSFNAAAALVEEGAATPAQLQPPQGAPPAPPSMNAVR